MAVISTNGRNLLLQRARSERRLLAGGIFGESVAYEIACASAGWARKLPVLTCNKEQRKDTMKNFLFRLTFSVFLFLAQGANIFDEEAERMWTSIWLFYANSTDGGGDYGFFANGRNPDY
jgi:hypothetical protein